jgi:putative addiction module killer protein
MGGIVNFTEKMLTTVDSPHTVIYSSHMIEVRKTTIFSKWFDSLKDRKARARIQVRIDRLELGNFGDTAPVGSGVSELRILYGPGYRVYYVQKGNVLVVLLSGGDKSTQPADIAKAKDIAKQLED